jgi:ADP-heptose:LPS heptosyltransferase/2-polyprenyl-3-methyl-5-hydroxy-6-metoxy-1,4-benzoquinol methylase
MSKKKHTKISKDVLVTVFLIAESAEDQHVANAIKNVIEQTHKNIDLLVVSFEDREELRKSTVETALNMRWLKADAGPEFIQEILQYAQGDIVFYKTVTNALWFPRHIDVHLDEFRKDPNAKWALSHVEYRNLAMPDHPLNTIGYRISNPPKVEEISLDEVAHFADVQVDWTQCVVQHPKNPAEPLFLAGLAMKQWLEKNIRGCIPPEISVVEWKSLDEGNHSMEEVAKQIGAPARTEIKDETNFVDGNISITRDFPTIVGNVAFEDNYNNVIREQADQAKDVKSIAIKRSVGMGDVLLVEPIIKKLRQKYPEAKIKLYTAKKGITDYFVHKADEVEEIGEDKLLTDFLGENSKEQIKFDLDLSYESRVGSSFIDAYAAVCGIEFDDYKDKHARLVTKNSMTFDNYVVLCADGSGWPGKQWSLEKVTETVKQLQAKGFTVIETGYFHSDLTEPKYHEAEFDLMMDLIANCKLYIGADNGPMHVARGFNKPCVTIAGAALPYYTNPNREFIYYVQDNNNPHLGDKHKMFFSMNGGSITFVPNNQEDPSCGLNLITPEHVTAAAEKVMTCSGNPFTENIAEFYFNIPGTSYYIDQNNDFITKEDVTKHPDQDKDISEEYSHRWEQILNDHAVPWIEMIKKYKDGGVLLDVGCNIGCTVKAASDAGFEAWGCDINQPSIDKSHELFPELKDKITVGNESYNKWLDVITCDQVFEHVENPIKFVHDLGLLLNDNGMIFIGTPNFRSKEAGMLFHKWGQTGTGEHTWLPTPRSIEYVMNKTGLEWEHIQDPEEGFIIRAWKA